MGKFSQLPIFLDVSHWNPRVNFEVLKGRVMCVVAKMFEVRETVTPDYYVDSKFQANLVGAAKYGIPFGAYIFVDTTYWVKAQVNASKIDEIDNMFDSSKSDNSAYAAEVIKQDPQIRQLLKEWVIGDAWLTNPNALKTLGKRRVNFLVLDVERWWRYYNQYATNAGTAEKIGDFWMNKSYRVLYDRIDKFMRMGYLPRIPVMIYTAEWVTTYSPSLGDSLQFYDTWIADYTAPLGAGKVTTLENFRAEQLANIPDTWKHDVLGKDMKALQLTDKFSIPEVTNDLSQPKPVDINVWMKPVEDFFDYINYEPVIIDPTSPSASPSSSPSSPPEDNPDLAAIMAKLEELETMLAEVRGVFK